MTQARRELGMLKRMISLSKPLDKALVKKAKHDGVSVSEVVRRMLAEGFERFSR